MRVLGVSIIAVIISISCSKNGPAEPDDYSGRLEMIDSLNSHTVAFWSFEDDDTLVSDKSSYMLNGTVYGAQNMCGVINESFRFNGTDAYIRIHEEDGSPPKEISELTKGSISVWFLCDSIPEEDGILPVFYYGSNENCLNRFDASNQGMIIEIGHSPVHYQSKRIYFTMFTNGCTTPSLCFDSDFNLEAGQWYNFVLVVGDNYNTGYLNGEEIIGRHYNYGSPSTSLFFDDALSHEALFLGKGFWDDREVYFDGQIDDIHIFDKALNQEEVTYLFGRQVSSLIPFEKICNIH